MSYHLRQTTSAGAPPSPTRPGGRSLSSVTSNYVSSPSSSTGQRRGVVTLGGLPPPPPGVSPHLNNHRSSYSQAIAKSMTIEEMRELHHRAQREAEAKRTELRLVLASRYRELVGNSDEVIRMKERSKELHDLVHALPSLLEKLSHPVFAHDSAKVAEEKKDGEGSKAGLRHKLSSLPRLVYRFLDSNDVYQSTTKLIELFTLIASQTDVFLLANTLAIQPVSKQGAVEMDPSLEAHIRMVFLQVQTLPRKITGIALRSLMQAASYGTEKDPSFGAEISASAMSSVDLLDVTKSQDRGAYLLEKYYLSKSKLLLSLLDQLSCDNDEGGSGDASTDSAEAILSKIVLIIQYDSILHPFQIFCLRRFPCRRNSDQDIMRSLPEFDHQLVKSRCSKFLASHLPLIRTKVKSVLVKIAGTTASALGQIRQSLYDKTDGVECMERLDNNGVCTWEDAVKGMIDIHSVLAGDTSAAPAALEERRFSLWSTLFSNTFSSLVHSLLTSAFQSVHTQVVSTLRTSLANAPPLSDILPHEAYRNTLHIASDLDKALLRVSEDAHELLVHAEERVESERRLRQSLYVQTCEIMGRLICELRLMEQKADDELSDATKDLIVGRLCFLLKFRLTSLPTLLDPQSSPAALHSTSGMISFLDMRSAFELADHNEDGLITFDEAMEAVESAFSGTQFRGAQLFRETLLIPSKDGDVKSSGDKSGSSGVTNVTLNELTLLAARGLRHEATGEGSALGIVQQSLDDIVKRCFRRWAVAALKESTVNLESNLSDFLTTASSVNDEEWHRLHSSEASSATKGENIGSAVEAVNDVSPHIICHLLDASSILNRTTCPSDSLVPVPSLEYANSLGIRCSEKESFSTLADNLRLVLVRQSMLSVASMFGKQLLAAEVSRLDDSGVTAVAQLYLDVSFLKTCYLERNFICSRSASEVGPDVSAAKFTMEKVISQAEESMRRRGGGSMSVLASLKDKQKRVFEGCDLFISSLFGEGSASTVSAVGELDLVGGRASATPLFRAPLPSSRRFVLLPVQADRSLSEIQLRGKYNKEKESSTNRPESASGSVMSSGLGFLSSMLKKN